MQVLKNSVESRQLLKNKHKIGLPWLGDNMRYSAYYQKFLRARCKGNERGDVEKTVMSHRHVKILREQNYAELKGFAENGTVEQR